MDFGMRFSPEGLYAAGLDGVRCGHRAEGGGAAIVEVLADHVDACGDYACDQYACIAPAARRRPGMAQRLAAALMFDDFETRLLMIAVACVRLSRLTMAASCQPRRWSAR